VDVVYFPSFGGRMFFIAAQPAHAVQLQERVGSFKVKAKELLGPRRMDWYGPPMRASIRHLASVARHRSAMAT
jgi:hypothetical protein